MTEQKVTQQTCRHCGRGIVNVDGVWTDPEATGDDSVWRETCDMHDTFDAVHEPTVASHTPGSWVFQPDDPAQGFIYGEDGAGRVVASVDCTDESDAANARLIAAAPDLLDAVRNYLSEGGFLHGPKCPAAVNMTRPEYDQSLCDPAVCSEAQLRNAVAKAEGR